MLWLLRIGELALRSAREGARRQSASELICGCQILICWSLALVGNQLDFGDTDSNEWVSDISALLIWAGAVLWVWGQIARPLRELLLPGPHLPLVRSCVAPNAVFFHHRTNEFMFLMLGETVLQVPHPSPRLNPPLKPCARASCVVTQIVIGTNARGTDEGRSDPTLFALTLVTGGMAFVIATCMMSSFRTVVGSQTEADEHLAHELETLGARETRVHLALRYQGKSMRGLVRRANAASTIEKTHKAAILREDYAERLMRKKMVHDGLVALLWQVKAVAVMLTGVGVKLAIYDPLADGGQGRDVRARLMVGLPLAVVFASQLVFSILFQNRHHCIRAQGGSNRGHASCRNLQCRKAQCRKAQCRNAARRNAMPRSSLVPLPATTLTASA